MHGKCDQGKCVCDVGWTGDKCDQLPCDERCSDHGQCRNGTCVCSRGWNGKHCTFRKSSFKLAFDEYFQRFSCFYGLWLLYMLRWLNTGMHLNLFTFLEGCENGCGNHGNCVLANNEYSCMCDEGWESASCSVRLEMECNDEVDNDQGTFDKIITVYVIHVVPDSFVLQLC